MVTIINRKTTGEKLREILRQHMRNRPKMLNLAKYCGILKLHSDPLKLQNEWRNE